jgi:hypothetical protein
MCAPEVPACGPVRDGNQVAAPRLLDIAPQKTSGNPMETPWKPPRNHLKSPEITSATRQKKTAHDRNTTELSFASAMSVPYLQQRRNHVETT